MTTQFYKDQVSLLLKVIPIVEQEKCFALHGGTAINLFIRDMPRLSVDIDLTYVPFEDRETSLKNVKEALERIISMTEHKLPNVQAVMNQRGDKLLCSSDGVKIKVEVNNTMRGVLDKPQQRLLSESAQREFRALCRIQTVPLGQLYGGKICAALDRQHPRDLFDVKYLLENEGFSDEVKTGFLLCLLSSDRPINEVILPTLKDQRSVMTNQFEGMSTEAFTYVDFEQTRDKLIEAIHENLTAKDKEFLLSVKNATPNWDIYDFSKFPAVQWKLLHIQRLKDNDPSKHAKQLAALKEKLKV